MFVIAGEIVLEADNGGKSASVNRLSPESGDVSELSDVAAEGTVEGESFCELFEELLVTSGTLSPIGTVSMLAIRSMHPIVIAELELRLEVCTEVWLSVSETSAGICVL